jgi:hypothetical protein
MVQFLCLMLLERKEEFESRSRMRECNVVLMYSGGNCSQQGGAKRALESWIKRISGSSTFDRDQAARNGKLWHETTNSSTPLRGSIQPKTASKVSGNSQVIKQVTISTAV